MFKNLVSRLFGRKEEKVQTRNWTRQEEKELAELISARVPKSRITEITGRSLNSINYKLIQTFGSSNVKVLSSKKLSVVK